MKTNHLRIGTVTVLGAVTAVAMLSGCVRRTLKITTEPPSALVFLNEEEVGRSDITRDFLWYGDYSVIIRKEGYKTLKTHWDIKPPWYQRIPIDFFAEVLWPGHIHDTHETHFVLEKQEWPTSEELVNRAKELQARAHDLRQ
ncbi:MAG: PEGA domain-containing protein [Planctomycetes bacterium]|nr:PEGA domain-containing protein [Planctomycetota bacterium]